MATVDLQVLSEVGAVSTLIVSSAGADLILWPDAESSEEEAELAAFHEAIGGLLERLRSEGRDAFLRKLGTAPSAADNPLSRSLDTAYKSLELSTWYALSPSASDKRRPPTARRGSHNWAASAHLDSAASALTALARDADLAEPSAAQHPAAVAHTESIRAFKAAFLAEHGRPPKSREDWAGAPAAARRLLRRKGAAAMGDDGEEESGAAASEARATPSTPLHTEAEIMEEIMAGAAEVLGSVEARVADPSLLSSTALDQMTNAAARRLQRAFRGALAKRADRRRQEVQWRRVCSVRAQAEELARAFESQLEAPTSLSSTANPKPPPPPRRRRASRGGRRSRAGWWQRRRCMR